jgi:hypothetical protein
MNGFALYKIVLRLPKLDRRNVHTQCACPHFLLSPDSRQLILLVFSRLSLLITYRRYMVDLPFW